MSLFKIKSKKLLFVMALAFLFRFPAIYLPHNENDEIVLTTLSKRFDFNINSYSLQNSTLLENLPKYIYDQKIFHHPPAFVMLGKAVSLIVGSQYIVIISILAGVTLVYFVWKIVFLIFPNKKEAESIALLASILLAIDPLNVFVSSKVWMDSLLSTFLLGSLYYSMSKKSNLLLFTMLTGALLTKLTALILFPMLFTIFLAKRKKILYAWPFLIAIFIAFVWFATYHKHTGVWFLDVRPNVDFIARFPYVSKVVNRPFFFYFFQIIFLNPLMLFSYIFILKSIETKHIKSINFLALILYVGTYLLAFTAFGLSGGGFQMRYIAPVSAPLIILTSAYLYQHPRLKRLLLLFMIPLIMTISIFNSYVIHGADPTFSLGVKW